MGVLGVLSKKLRLLRGFVLLHHRCRDPAAFADLLAVGPGPFAHCRCVGALPRTACLARPTGCLACMLDVPAERASQSSGVLAGEIDLIGGAVHGEPYGLVCRAAVDVVLEDYLYPAAPSRPPWLADVIVRESDHETGRDSPVVTRAWSALAHDGSRRPGAYGKDCAQ